MSNFKAKEQFPIFKKFPELVYLDNAATTHKPERVIRRMTEFYSNEYGTIRRGVYPLSATATSKFEDARATVAKFIGAQKEEIAFTPGTTASINFLAYGFFDKVLEEGDNILVTHLDHHANLVPWQQLAERKGAEIKYLPFNSQGELSLDKLSELTNERTRLLAFPSISNTLGSMAPIKQLTTFARKNNIYTVIDAAQSAALHSLDVKMLNCDFLNFSGHKVFGPTGIGVLFASKVCSEHMAPLLTGGGMVTDVSEESSSFMPYPYNMEAGTPHIAGAIGLAEAITFLSEIDRAAVLKQIEYLSNYCISKLEALEEVEIYGPKNNTSGIIPFNIKGIHPHDVASFLAEDQIAVRAGRHCTQILHQKMKLQGTVRASFSIYNEQSDADRLIKSIKHLISSWK